MKTFESNILNIYGERGRTWLSELPRVTAEATERYGLSGLKPVSNLSYHYVLSGYQDNRPIILKLGIDVAGLKHEAITLKAFAGFGAVEVLSEGNGVLLLERAVPGNSLKSYFPSKDEEAIQIICDVMDRLHQALLPMSGFSHIEDWLMVLDKEWDIPVDYLQKARTLRDELLATSTEPVLLHGDLHQDNVLQQGDGWLVIDPKGVLGEPAYEVAAFIRNPISEISSIKNMNNLFQKRIASFAKTLRLDPNRIQDWCFVQAILAWVWVLEDGSGDAAIFKHLAKILDSLEK